MTDNDKYRVTEQSIHTSEGVYEPGDVIVPTAAVLEAFSDNLQPADDDEAVDADLTQTLTADDGNGDAGEPATTQNEPAGPQQAEEDVEEARSFQGDTRERASATDEPGQPGENTVDPDVVSDEGPAEEPQSGTDGEGGTATGDGAEGESADSESDTSPQESQESDTAAESAEAVPDDYDDYNVQEAREHAQGLSAEEVDRLIEYEEANKDRSTLLEDLRELRDEKA